jgi:uncharacterized protein YcbK (DUF882 family)
MSNFFQPSELACKCGRPNCDAAPIDPILIIKLDGLRRELNEPMKLTSARRCDFWNRSPTVRGSKDSQHLQGKAIDCWCPNAAFAWRLVRLAVKHGFIGLGVGRNFIHLDVRAGTVPILFGYR